MTRDKLLAEWFWTDRWMGSSAFLLPMEARGLYREMLTQAWRRQARLPNDHEAIRRAVGCTVDEWTRCWPLIEHYWRIDGKTIVNDTQLEIYADTADLSTKRSEAGRLGNQTRWSQTASQTASQNGRKVIANGIASHIAKESPPSPSPSPSPSLNNPSKIKNHPKRVDPSESAAAAKTSARSKRPIFTGQRITVFEWQLDNLSQILGPNTDTFDLHSWFFTLDAAATTSTKLIPKRDGGAWLEAELLAEAKRRGLTIATHGNGKISAQGMANAETFARVAQQIMDGR